MKCPILIQFKPGQYAFLKISSIDNQWHHFFIASAPGSLHLEFYIELFNKSSWTKQLWNILQKGLKGDHRGSFCLWADVMGPYGTSLTKMEDYSQVLALGGAGTGKACWTICVMPPLLETLGPNFCLFPLQASFQFWVS
jgi:predicted ferric reductase